MKFVSVSCGTETNKHPKGTAVDDIREAYRLVRCHDPEALNYVSVTILLVKEDLHPEAFSALLKDVLQVPPNLKETPTLTALISLKIFKSVTKL